MIKRDFKSGVIYHGDCVDVLPLIGKFDHILTDPPYGYLNHRIESDFDYADVFTKLRYGINPKSGIIIFGRGDLFFKWNLYLAELGFEHKEDCVYNKSKAPNMLNNFMRNGEYFTIRGVTGFSINKVYIPLEDEANISEKQIAGWLRRSKGDRSGVVKRYLETGEKTYDKNNKSRENVSTSRNFKKSSTSVGTAQSLLRGKILGNVISAPRELLSEGSHPTVKSHEVMRYLVKAISSEGQTIIDPFLGSGGTGLACAKEGRRFIGIERGKEYFDLACGRVEECEDGRLF